MRRRDVVLGLVLCAVAAAGCRPAQSERAGEATRTFLEALDRGNGAAACERLSQSGVSELLLLALEHRVDFDPAEAHLPDTCGRIAERLPAGDLGRLLRSPVSRGVVHGDRATVETEAGSYELEEREGEWYVSRFEPVARALRETTPRTPPVTLTVVRPEDLRTALGGSVAGESTDEELELSGTLAPPGARLAARRVSGGSVESVEAADGRFRVRLRLRPGRNAFVLTATAPGREPALQAVSIERE